jgi:Fe-S-cluster-containing dehydrogenase component
MRWVAYDAAESRAGIDATATAFGAPQREIYDFSKAKTIVSLGRDFLSTTGEPNGLTHARDFAATRRVLVTKDPMSRLYVVEPAYTITGGQADHRISMAPSQIVRVAVAIASGVLAKVGGEAAGALRGELAGKAADLDGSTRAFVDAATEDLVAAGAGGLVVAGPTTSKDVHALAHAINAALGAIGTTVSFMPMGPEQASDGLAELSALAGEAAAGSVTTIICVGANPIYDAPTGLHFAEAFKKAATITWSVGESETSHASNWSLNGAHTLESWGDTEAWDGTIAPVQPMIAPLYEPAMSELEFLELLAQVGVGGSRTTPKVSGYEIVRAAWQGRLGQVGFEKIWTRSLFDGVLANSTRKPAPVTANFGAIAAAVRAMALEPAASSAGLEVVFQTNHQYDGRFANIPWLQELPDAGTRVVWDNPALVSPRTAVALGLAPRGMGENMSLEKASNVYTSPKYPTGRVVTLGVDGKSMEVALWIAPGVADNTVVLTLGYGRKQSGLVGTGVGFDTYALFSGARVARGAKASDTGRTYLLASTQTHWSLEGRTALVRGLDRPAWEKFGDESPKEFKDRLYGTAAALNLAERIGHGELTHTPPNISLYANPLNSAKGDAAPGSRYSKGPQWAMSIDLSTCTGCGACTIACQAENNIPVVGKKDVAKGREMTWIRVDRYFTGDDVNNPDAMLHQPVACLHCENAPCEVVCPVNATIHGDEGLNYMAYNRCIGTRYCANNCPYKVRRFNFHDYGVAKFKGDYIGKDAFPQAGERNPNLIPPRLRERLNEIEKMQKNPNVTVRSRGVMERCSFCIQRINAAKVEVKLRNLASAPGVPEGFFQTACQQACPSESIVFGDMLDTTANAGKGSLVRQMREHNRTYALLGFLNTRPRTTHMAAVKNPNRTLLEKLGKSERLRLMDDPFGHHGGDHHDSGPGDDHATPAPAGGGHSMLHGTRDPSRSMFIRDAAKKATDRGYALSLSVLSSFTGLNA